MEVEDLLREEKLIRDELSRDELRGHGSTVHQRGDGKRQHEPERRDQGTRNEQCGNIPVDLRSLKQLFVHSVNPIYALMTKSYKTS